MLLVNIQLAPDVISEDGDNPIDRSTTTYFGFKLAPGYELVLSPKAIVGRREDDAIGIDYGGSVGLRCGDATRSWAVHPEVGVFRSEDNDGSLTLVTLGFAISAGN